MQHQVEQPVHPAVTTGAAGERVAEDEARFLDRSRTRSCVVEDRVTTN